MTNYKITLYKPHKCCFCFLFFFLQLFAQRCKVICERNTKSNARHITFPVPAHTITKDSHNTGNFMPCSFSNSVYMSSLTFHFELINMDGICEIGSMEIGMESETKTSKIVMTIFYKLIAKKCQIEKKNHCILK